MATDLTEASDQRIVADWALGEWADRLLEQAGLAVTIVDRLFLHRLGEVAGLAVQVCGSTATPPPTRG
jgi:hypothetical protein